MRPKRISDRTTLIVSPGRIELRQDGFDGDAGGIVIVGPTAAKNLLPVLKKFVDDMQKSAGPVAVGAGKRK